MRSVLRFRPVGGMVGGERTFGFATQTRAPRLTIGLRSGAGMAIYSLNLKSIGRTTHAAGTAAAHIGYVTRSQACTMHFGEHIPGSPAQAREWMDKQELADRKNARVCDKVRVALPRELNAAQRAELVRDFAGQVTQGRTPWLAAFHDRGKDRHNPHCHLVVRDRDVETGTRVFKFTERDAADRIRLLWEKTANRHLESAGFTERIDRRTLAAQGVDRPAGIHVGPKAKAATDRGVRPKSNVVHVNFRDPAKRAGGRRKIDYPAIDAGRTRAEFNADRLAEYREAWDAYDLLKQWDAEDVAQGKPSLFDPKTGELRDGRLKPRDPRFPHLSARDDWPPKPNRPPPNMTAAERRELAEYWRGFGRRDRPFDPNVNDGISYQDEIPERYPELDPRKIGEPVDKPKLTPAVDTAREAARFERQVGKALTAAERRHARSTKAEERWREQHRELGREDLPGTRA